MFSSSISLWMRLRTDPDANGIIDALRRNRIFFPFMPGCRMAGSNNARFALHHLL